MIGREARKMESSPGIPQVLDTELILYFYKKLIMKITEHKKDIIRGILTTDDEWVLKAIRKLLDIEEIPEEHKLILNERLEEYKINSDDLINWDELKKELMG